MIPKGAILATQEPSSSAHRDVTSHHVEHVAGLAGIVPPAPTVDGLRRYFQDVHGVAVIYAVRLREQAQAAAANGNHEAADQLEREAARFDGCATDVAARADL